MRKKNKRKGKAICLLATVSLIKLAVVAPSIPKVFYLVLILILLIEFIYGFGVAKGELKCLV